MSAAVAAEVQSMATVSIDRLLLDHSMLRRNYRIVQARSRKLEVLTVKLTLAHRFTQLSTDPNDPGPHPIQKQCLELAHAEHRRVDVAPQFSTLPL